MADMFETPEEYLRRAEDLASTALSASMAGFWRRGRRRELLAAAQVYASLAQAAAVVQEQPIQAATRKETQP